MAVAMMIDRLDEPVAPTTLQPWSAVMRAARRCGHAPAANPEQFTALGARLGIDLSFDDLGYEARFALVATDLADAAATAQRRWFYLADDLGLPSWPVTDVSVASIDA